MGKLLGLTLVIVAAIIVYYEQNVSHSENTLLLAGIVGALGIAIMIFSRPKQRAPGGW